MQDSLRSRRVLVVEDEYFIAQEIAAALVELGAEIVGPAATIADAMHILDEDGDVHLAVLDINLRGQSSFALARTLAERETPFLFATGYDRAALPPDQCAVPLWEKPFNADQLALALSRME